MPHYNTLTLPTFNIGMKDRFKEVLFDDFTEPQLRLIWDGLLAKHDWVADDDVCAVAARRVARGMGRKGFSNARAVRKLWERANLSALNRGIEDGVPPQVVMEDVMGAPPELRGAGGVTGLGRAFAKLDDFIGLRAVKDELRKLYEMAKENYYLEISGKKPSAVALNRMFLGNPGTGKVRVLRVGAVVVLCRCCLIRILPLLTAIAWSVLAPQTTIAEVYGLVLKELGLLSDGSVEVKTASDFVGSHVGETSTKTSAILQLCEGKVLVIDEAYNLDDNMYGKQALDTIVEKVTT